MALPNLSGWAGSACGASGKPEERPSACGTGGKELHTVPGEASPCRGTFQLTGCWTC